MVERKKSIKIKLSEKDRDCIEDIFFCKLTKEQYKKIKPRLIKIWKQLCNKMEQGIK